MPKNKTYFEQSTINQSFFWWITPIINKIYKQGFDPKMLFELHNEDQTKRIGDEFEQMWHKTKNQSYPLVKTCLKMCNGSLILAISLYLISGLSSFMLPWMISYMIDLASKANELSYFELLKYISLIPFVLILRTTVKAQAKYWLYRCKCYYGTGVRCLIYNKLLKFSLLKKSKYNSGSLLTYITEDTYQFEEIVPKVGMIIKFPIQFIIGAFLIYNFIGLHIIWAILALLAGGLVDQRLAKVIDKHQSEYVDFKEDRIRYTEEIFSNIRYIKMLGWEQHFSEVIEGKRDKELAAEYAQQITENKQTFVSCMSNAVMRTAAFFGYILINETTQANEIFMTTTSLDIIKESILDFPFVVRCFQRLNRACTRIQNFLMAEEVDTTYIEYLKEDSPYSITVSDGNFYWPQREEISSEESDEEEQDIVNKKSSNEEFKLKNINLKIPKGKLVVIIGDIGSGKSSLLYSLVSEMNQVPPQQNAKPSKIQIFGDISYVGENAWILNKSLKENVLFGEPFDEKRYKQSLVYSCLDKDVDILHQGDETMIGEKGLNLSGGQKARLSLARAIYHNRDILLMDDPLSAVDANVTQKILQNCLLDYLKDKTRILVTHKLEIAKSADITLIMKDGSIVEELSAEQLQKSQIYQDLYQKFKVSQEANKLENETIEFGEVKRQLSNQISFEEVVSEEDPNFGLVQKLNNTNFDEEWTNLGFRSWKEFFNQYGGLKFFSKIFLIMLLRCACTTGCFFVYQYWSDSGAQGFDANLKYVLYYFIIGGTGEFLLFIKSIPFLRQGNLTAKRLHKQMFNSTIRAPVSKFFDLIPLGSLLKRFLNDIGWLASGGMLYFTQVITSVFDLVENFIILSVYSSPFNLIIQIFGIKFALQNSQKITKATRRIKSYSQGSEQRLLNVFPTTMNGLVTIRAYKKQDFQMQEYISSHDQFLQYEFLSVGSDSFHVLAIGIITGIMIIPSIFLPLATSASSELTPGFIAFIFTYCFYTEECINTVMDQVHYFEEYVAELERCLQIARIKPEPQYELATDKKFDIESGKIEFQNVSLKYRDDLPYVLKKASFVVEKTHKIGIVGRTGAGKSTLFLSLLNLITPTNGKILIDDQDISKVNLSQLREQITIVPQDPILFEGNIRENIDIFNQYTDTQIWKALDKVSLGKKFEKLDGLKTKIAGQGSNLSSGEKQLICLARAILSQNKIVFFDEATSNIDVETEEQILKIIEEEFKQKTVMMIAHRLKTIMGADKLLVMDNGKISQYDSPQKLLQNKNGIFYKLYEEYQKG